MNSNILIMGSSVGIGARLCEDFSKPKDISNMITYLLNKENSWIAGQDFIVDGGLSSTK